MPIDIQKHAQENLSFIRGAMERAERVSAVSGAGAITMGVIALVAMAVAATVGDFAEQLTVWIVTAFAAGLAGVLGSALKARQNDLALFGDPGRRFLLCLIPALLVGAVLTAALLATPQLVLLPSLWMMLYGTGVLAAGTYAAPPVMYMGAGFIVTGLFAHALPWEWSNVLLGTSFGGLHLVFGYQVYRHHGG